MKRIPSLDGLRAISVSLVLIGHLARAGHTPQFMATYAGAGVRVFFVISGYLITTILLNEHARTSTINLREFYIRRAYRILPAAGVFMLFAMIVYWHELTWINIAAMLLYLVNYDPNKPWMIGHLWSLGVEEQFYLLWPTVLRRFERHKVAVLLTVVAMSPIFSVLFRYLKLSMILLASFPVVATTLAIGCLLAVFGPKLPKIRSWMALVMLLVVIFSPYYAGDTRLKTLFELFVLWPIVDCCVAGLLLHVVQTPYRVLNLAPIVWLGRISYSLYLWQQPFFFAPPGQPAYKLLFGIGLACLSFYLVEQPVLRLRERRAASLSSAVAADRTAVPIKPVRA